jgi:pheromone shutdown protein TraB
MITLIGTGHVFDLSNQIRSILDEKQPDIICVELDEKRYAGLMQKRNGTSHQASYQKNSSFLYQLLGRFQDSMAQQYGVHAGDEMLTGIQFAHDHQRPIAFIDVAADRMFKRMLIEMSITEKIRLFFSAFASLFVSKKQVDKQINNLETNLENYLEEIGKKFPTVKRVLIDERNNHMVQQLKRAHEEYENIVAIVGDGHIPGLQSLLQEKDESVESIRLKELRALKTKPENMSNASFSVEYNTL